MKRAAPRVETDSHNLRSEGAKKSFTLTRHPFHSIHFQLDGDGKKEMLRKKYHVVRKKNHVVRKLFYVASIFDGAAGRQNGTPWKKVPTAGEVSSTAG